MDGLEPREISVADRWPGEVGACRSLQVLSVFRLSGIGAEHAARWRTGACEERYWIPSKLSINFPPALPRWRWPV